MSSCASLMRLTARPPSGFLALLLTPPFNVNLGNSVTNRQVGSAAAADGLTKTYLDDRSFSTSTASSLLSKVAAWEDFSVRVGLSESPDKLQLTATSKLGLEALRNEAPYPTKVSESFEALGVCARFKPRSNTAKETSRLDSALRVTTVLGNLRLPWARFQQEARCFGTSKVAYGWLSRCATQRDCWKVWAAVRRGQHCLYRANGGSSHLDALVGTNLFRIVARMFEHNAREWHRRPGTPLRALRDWLADKGWSEHAPRSWKGAEPHCDLALPVAQNALPAQLHAVREGWRHHQWCSFLFQGHETEELWDVPNNVFFDTDFERTRAVIGGRAAARSVGLLATRPPFMMGPSPRLLGAAGQVARSLALGGMSPGRALVVQHMLRRISRLSSFGSGGSGRAAERATSLPCSG